MESKTGLEVTERQDRRRYPINIQVRCYQCGRSWGFSYFSREEMHEKLSPNWDVCARCGAPVTGEVIED